MTDTRSSALFKRAEQLKRWEESDTNKQSILPKRASKIKFSSGIVFLAACTSGDKEEVQRLLKMGADINTANVDGLTALHQACIDDNLDMVEFLVSRGADVNRGDNEGWTPLHATASCGFLSIARFLLESGANAAAVNYDGELPLDIADSDSMEQMLQKVIDTKGIDCELARNAEVNALKSDAKKWAANGYIELQDPKTGGTPLHVAAAKGYADVATILLEECGANPDCIDFEGWTPLHAAALWGQKDAAALLIKHGADMDVKNFSGQTCMDLADPSISIWLADASFKAKRQKNNNNNNNKRKHSPPRNDVKNVELQLTGQTDNATNDVATNSSEKISKVSEAKPPKGRAPSPEPASEPTENNSNPEDAPSWRRSASLRSRQNDTNRDNNKVPSTNNTQATDNDTILRRTHSFENDKTFYQRYRDVTARIKATSCPIIPPLPKTTVPPIHIALELKKKVPNNIQESTNLPFDNTNEEVQLRTNAPERKERDSNAWNSNAQTTVRRSFVPPVRDEESETQRKAHAKRVRETRRSTQGVTLDEIKSAEQFVRNRSGNGTVAAPDVPSTTASPVTLTTTSTDATATETVSNNAIASNNFELEDAIRPASPAPPTSSAPAADTTVTLPLRRPPSAAVTSTATTTVAAVGVAISTSEEKAPEDEREREGSSESRSSTAAGTPASTQAALNVIQRRRRPKRRSTGVGHVDMDDIVNDRGGGGEGDSEGDATPSGSERTCEAEVPAGEVAEGEKDYKALYEASAADVRRLRSLLSTSEQQLRDSRATITRLTQINQNSLTELEKREKRAMERKLSEMEEELKFQQALQAENQRLKDENGALIRVISKLSK